MIRVIRGLVVLSFDSVILTDKHIFLNTSSGSLEASFPYARLGPFKSQNGLLWMDYSDNTWQAFHYQNDEKQYINVSLDVPPYYRYAYTQNDSIVWLTPLESNNRMQGSLVKLNTNTLQCSPKIVLPTDTAVVYSYHDKVINTYKDGLFIYHKNRKMLLLLNPKHAVHQIDFKKPIRQAFLKDEKTLLVLSGNDLYSVDLDTKQQHILLSHSHALFAALYHQNALFAVDATGLFFVKRGL